MVVVSALMWKTAGTRNRNTARGVSESPGGGGDHDNGGDGVK